MRNMTKLFKIKSENIQPIITGFGGCIATDYITVEGRLVMYMYREKPKNTDDSGWRFFAGLEDDEYMSNKFNHGVYDVNTIANYDPSIISYLTAKIGSQFERNEEDSSFNEITQ